MVRQKIHHRQPDRLIHEAVERERKSKLSPQMQLALDRKEYRKLVKKQPKESNCSILEQIDINLNAHAPDEEAPLWNKSLSAYPTDPLLQNELADLLKKWVMKGYPNEVPKRLDEFAIMNNMNFFQFKRMAATNNYFRETLEFCGNVISQRVYNRWDEQECDKDYARDFLYEHDRTFAERHHRLTALKNQEVVERPKQVVEIKTIPNCPEVPERKKDVRQE
jgi:hypothetical protein